MDDTISFLLGIIVGVFICLMIVGAKMKSLEDQPSQLRIKIAKFNESK